MYFEGNFCSFWHFFFNGICSFFGPQKLKKKFSAGFVVFLFFFFYIFPNFDIKKIKIGKYIKKIKKTTNPAENFFINFCGPKKLQIPLEKKVPIRSENTFKIH